jgi:hypothetical protein
MPLALRRRGVTAPLKSRRYREKKNGKEAKATVTVRRPGVVTIGTPETCSLAARLTDGPATAEDLRMAERLIMELVFRLPRDSSLDVG